jgi:hypothetical protein
MLISEKIKKEIDMNEKLLEKQNHKDGLLLSNHMLCMYIQGLNRALDLVNEE